MNQITRRCGYIHRFTRRPVIRPSRKSFQVTTRPEVPHTEIVLLTLFQIRERPGPEFPACGDAGSCFFRVEREELPYKSARGLKKREEEEDGRTGERAGERTISTNERRQRWKLPWRRKKRRKKRRATVGGGVRSFVRSFLRTIRIYAVLPASSLQPLIDSQMDK